MGGSAFVTGGTGFVGSHLVEELLRRGVNVRCLVRRDPKWLKGLDLEVIHGDGSDSDALRRGVEGVDQVFHVAGLTRSARWEDLVEANVQGTLNLLDAVIEVNPSVRNVLVTSSLAAVGPSLNGCLTEDSPLNPISMYGRSKAEMERAVREYFDRIPIVVVRPAAVYGPREADIYTFFKAVRRGICPIIGSGTEPQLSLVHVSDLVRGMIDAAASSQTRGRTYFLGSERFYSWEEIRAVTLAAMQTRALTIRVPVALVNMVGAGAESLGKLFGYYPPLNREKAREIRATWLCSIERAKADFGYRQEIELEEGIRQTIEWYKLEGWL